MNQPPADTVYRGEDTRDYETGRALPGSIAPLSLRRPPSSFVYPIFGSFHGRHATAVREYSGDPPDYGPPSKRTPGPALTGAGRLIKERGGILWRGVKGQGLRDEQWIISPHTHFLIIEVRDFFGDINTARNSISPVIFGDIGSPAIIH